MEAGLGGVVGDEVAGVEDHDVREVAVLWRTLGSCEHGVCGCMCGCVGACVCVCVCVCVCGRAG